MPRTKADMKPVEETKPTAPDPTPAPVATGDEVKSSGATGTSGSDKPMSGNSDVDLKSKREEHKTKKRSYPLAPHEELSEKREKITVELSEDVVQVYEDHKEVIQKIGADLIEAHARRMGWL